MLALRRRWRSGSPRSRRVAKPAAAPGLDRERSFRVSDAHVLERVVAAYELLCVGLGSVGAGRLGVLHKRNLIT